MAYEYLPEEVRALIGRETQRTEAPLAIEKSASDYWLQTCEDANPIYWSEEAAREAGYDTVVAPPAMLFVWGQPYNWNPYRGSVNRQVEGLAMLHFKMKKLMKRPVGIVGKTEVEYFRPVLLGDRLSYRERLVDVSDVKENKLGIGNYWTIEVIFSNQRGEDVGLQRIYMFGYGQEQGI